MDEDRSAEDAILKELERTGLCPECIEEGRDKYTIRLTRTEPTRFVCDRGHERRLIPNANQSEAAEAIRRNEARMKPVRAMFAEALRRRAREIAEEQLAAIDKRLAEGVTTRTRSTRA